MLQALPLAELARRYRAQARLSQEELAGRARVSVRTIGDIETGVSLWPRAITISLIAEALGLDEEARERLRAAARRRGQRRGGSGAAFPVPISLVGRLPEVATLRRLLLDPTTRLVTVTGEPGVGKTALAIAIAAQLAGEFPARARYVEFASLPDPILVPTKIALALGVRDVRGQPAAASVAAAIGDRSMLIVLDNFESVAAAAPVVAELLAAAPNLKLLVTSRTPLHVSMERVFKIGALSIASSIRLLSDPMDADAFAAQASDDSDLAALARALGGVPLALALAAPLLRTPARAELIDNLKRPLHVLGGMREAIALSYRSLSAGEQRLFRSLAVFGGPFTEEGAHYLASGGDSDASVLSTLQLLASLTDRSLVGVCDDGVGDAEFELHALVRDFAAEMLECERESEAAFLRLSSFCTSLAQAAPRVEPLEDGAARARCNRESSHFDAALGWLKSTNRIAPALALAIELWPIWWRRGENAHGYAWVRSLVAAAEERAEAVDAEVVADGNWAAAGLASASGRFDESERHTKLALAHKRAVGDRKAVASLIDGLGECASLKGHYADARRYFEEALTIRRELGDGLDIARTLVDFGTHASDAGNYDEANGHLEEALLLFRAAGRRMGVSLVLENLALVAVRSGSPERGVPLAREALRLAQEVGFAESARTARIVLSRALVGLDDLDGAESLALRVSADDETLGPSADVARLLAAIELRRGRTAVAARLLGAASTAADAPVIPLADRAAHEALVATVVEELGAGFDAQWEAGRRQSPHVILGAAGLLRE
ncbi:MAG TPA: tetratricopeptide repeat protein [Candidatus Cybelea sp.]|jgi:predicted ATPase/DNA-binding XRE family transcriptional regulator|nr:tetratricopeptide repeat protein [Candidatus Cybelea sp.]